ncbi:MAG: hypothetical protein ACPGVD_08280 [Flavobacteriales bacterium]
MKRLIYISILIIFFGSSFVKEKNLKDILIGGCWVNKSYDSDTYIKKLNFNPEKHGVRFINEKEMILFTKDHWCRSGGRNQKLGIWDTLNDSTIYVRYKAYNESVITYLYRTKKLNRRKIEMKFLSFEEQKKGDKPKPFLGNN